MDKELLTHVWRLENAKGEGPNSSDELSDVWMTLGERYYHYGMTSEKHPGPYQEPSLKDIWEDLNNQDQWLFGFRDLDQYDSWFAEAELKQAFHKYGGYLTCYQTRPPHVIHTDKQSVFVRSKATPVAFRFCHEDNVRF